MKLRRPSPATVISIVALVMATTGTAIAAVEYARNAGAVDGKSASSASVSLNAARGRLVATARGGRHAGRIPGKFVAGLVPAAPFGKAFEVVDGARGAAMDLSRLYGLGRLSASCNDESERPGHENPSTTVVYANTTAAPVNLARRAGGAAANVAAVLNGTQDSFTIQGSNTFTHHLERGGENVVVNGVVRQDGLNTAAASCLVYGTVQLVRP